MVCSLFFFGTLFGQKRKTRSVRSSDKIITVALDGSGQFSSIQEAIDFAEFNSRIKIKSGIYHEALMLKSFVNIDGEGVGKTIIISDGDQPVLQAYNLSGGLMTDLSFEFSKPTALPVFTARYSTFTIEKCSFRFGTYGADISSNSSVQMRQCTFASNSVSGVRIDKRSTGTVSGGLIFNNGGDGIQFIAYASSSVEHNIIRNNAGHGIILDKNSVNRITGNYIYDNGKNGIHVTGNASPILKNNTILKNGKDSNDTFGYGIFISNTASMTLINNNIVKNKFGIGVVNTRDIQLSYNNLWSNKDNNYVNISPSSTDVSFDPKFVNELQNDFRIDTSSALYVAGEKKLSIGADYDFVKSQNKQRTDYLKTQATKELARGNWYLAYQSAQEIVSIDKDDQEGKTLLKKSGSELAGHYIIQARDEFENDNINLANNFLRMAFTYDPESSEGKELKDRIDEQSRLDQIKFFGVLGLAIAGTFGLGFWARKRIQISELRRQAKWWLDDAEEHVELARGAESDKHAPDDMKLAVDQFKEAQTSFEHKDYEMCDRHCSETVRLSNRAREAADRYKQIRKDALFEVSNAEAEMRSFRESDIFVKFADGAKELAFYLERAQDALLHQQFVLAKEIAEDIQNSIRQFKDDYHKESESEVLKLIEQSEELTIAALASNTSADIIMAVIDFKAELELLKTGFKNGQITIDEVKPQIVQIKDFIEEVLRIGSSEETVPRSGRKKTFYEILGVKEDATVEQIKSVYRKLSMIYHPDMNVADELGIAGDNRFKEIKEAYEALMTEKAGK
ncbi:right-handed parallel beta-helix repeat-containing protein [bacterium]|nr:right-handed parallel beta-helix repeat-containing protein [bacterium]